MNLRLFSRKPHQESLSHQSLEQARDAVISFDAQGCVSYYNAAAQTLWGFGKDEVLGGPVSRLLPDEWHQTTTHGANHAKDSSPETEVICKDGSKVWVTISLSEVNDGNTVTYTAFIKNISADREFRERMRQTLEQTLDAVVSIDERNLVTFFNAAAEKLWGYQRSEVIGRNVNMLVPNQFREAHDSYVNANRQTGQDKVIGSSREVVIERKDGRRVWSALSLSRVRIGNAISYTAFMKDVSAERNAREQMRQTLYQALDAVISIDKENNITFFNPAAEKLWGLTQEEVMGQNVRMLVPFEIQASHDHYINTNRQTGINKVVGSHREVQIERRDGHRVWASLTLSKIEIDGEINYTAFVKDISAERQARDRLNQSLEGALIAIVSIDERNNVTSFNAAAERLWGYKRHEVIGHNVKMLVPAMIRNHHDQYIENNRRTGNNKVVGFRREVEIERKDGSKTWGVLMLSRIEIEDRINYIAYIEDSSADYQRRAMTREAMDAVKESSDRIGEIVAVIEAISEKTQMLSLNSAIEAARAGAAGRGFGVVAGEVKRLADSSSTSASDIGKLVVETRQRIDELSRALDSHSDGQMKTH